ncbi:hypothetical protein [Chitinophaga sp. RAB17]|uniref:hypothetical protein n=1 Tax=Chitinophaga sp. RAB17 TaxID=3233049 RepID=UPI003F9345ED
MKIDIDLDLACRHRFINYLVLNTSFSDTIGLLDGKSAAILYLYLNRSKFEADWIDHIAYTHLEEMLAQTSVFTPLTFGNGLSGLGAMLEFLSTSGYLEENVSDLLEDVEPKLLGLVYGGALKQAGIADGLSGLGLYFIHRIRSSSPAAPMMNLRYKEAVIACVEQIGMLYKAGRMSAMSTDFFSGLPGTLSFLYNAAAENIYEPETTSLIIQLANILLDKLTENDNLLSAAAGYLILSEIAGHYGELIRNEELMNNQRDWFNRMESADFGMLGVTAPLQLLFVRKLATRYERETSITQCDKIFEQLYDNMKDRSLKEIFPFDRGVNAIHTGLENGVVSLALPLHSIESGDYSWLSIFGINN